MNAASHDGDLKVHGDIRPLVGRQLPPDTDVLAQFLGRMAEHRSREWAWGALYKHHPESDFISKHADDTTLTSFAKRNNWTAFASLCHAWVMK
ncbi:hypothetical protein [Bradyrhizobium canariense]|uniref:hypothetical protein n=1 Tax=Bradyrhizobium canariense TaxID=255045 RepID=UPI00142F9DA9|nr:hypothetical protein [Bradyrhizobium canariense]